MKNEDKSDDEVVESCYKRPLHPWERKKIKEWKIAAGNSEAIASNFKFYSREFLNKSLLFNLKKTSEEKILDRLIKNLPEGNNEYYIEHRNGTNSFCRRQDKKQQEKDKLFKFIHNTDRKIARSLLTEKKNIADFKRLKRRAIELLKDLGEITKMSECELKKLFKSLQRDKKKCFIYRRIY